MFFTVLSATFLKNGTVMPFCIHRRPGLKNQAGQNTYPAGAADQYPKSGGVLIPLPHLHTLSQSLKIG